MKKARFLTFPINRLSEFQGIYMYAPLVIVLCLLVYVTLCSISRGIQIIQVKKAMSKTYRGKIVKRSDVTITNRTDRARLHEAF